MSGLGTLKNVACELNGAHVMVERESVRCCEDMRPEAATARGELHTRTIADWSPDPPPLESFLWTSTSPAGPRPRGATTGGTPPDISPRPSPPRPPSCPGDQRPSQQVCVCNCVRLGSPP